ncbi:MAG: tRNA threonylcarbamoyladenosine dehydratase [Candidatus Cloacimonetes bacterium]|nr:tRNA threonylcarbamoyladenosine dehydratase [Candidatus Cloacimonadota bacterium]
MNSAFNRTALLFGEKGMRKLQKSVVAIVGLGGVGSFAAEMLARSGVGTLIIIDFDRINSSNINRQIPALISTIGQYKCEALKARLEDINPLAKIIAYNDFCDSTNRVNVLKDADFIIDAIDSLGPKSGLLEFAYNNKQSIISCMGAANRVDPTKINLADINDVQGCPLAKRVKKYLNKRGIDRGIPVVYSSEEPLILYEVKTEVEELSSLKRGRERVKLGSTSYLPAIIAGWAVSYVLRNLVWNYSLYE